MNNNELLLELFKFLKVKKYKINILFLDDSNPDSLKVLYYNKPGSKYFTIPQFEVEISKKDAKRNLIDSIENIFPEIMKLTIDVYGNYINKCCKYNFIINVVTNTITFLISRSEWSSHNYSGLKQKPVLIDICKFIYDKNYLPKKSIVDINSINVLAFAIANNLISCKCSEYNDNKME